jgi:hypothetical protein
VTDREHLLSLIEEARAEMNQRLDALAAELRQSPPKAPRKRRAPMRPALSGPVLLPDDLAQKKARQALERMGLVRGRGWGRG